MGKIIYQDELVIFEEDRPIKVLDSQAFKQAMGSGLSIWQMREAIDKCAETSHNWDKTTFIDANIWKCKRCRIQYDLDDGTYY